MMKSLQQVLPQSQALLNTATVSQQHWDCREWLVQLATKLSVARGFTVPTERMAGIARLLMDARYTKAQAERAEAWILRGDWTYRGTQPTLLLSDFYPTQKEEQVQKELPKWEDIRYNYPPCGEPYIYFGDVEVHTQFEHWHRDGLRIFEKINSTQAQCFIDDAGRYYTEVVVFSPEKIVAQYIDGIESQPYLIITPS